MRKLYRNIDWLYPAYFTLFPLTTFEGIAISTARMAGFPGNLISYSLILRSANYFLKYFCINASNSVLLMGFVI